MARAPKSQPSRAERQTSRWVEIAVGRVPQAETLSIEVWVFALVYMYI